jgi:hypothetical protein
VVGNHVAISGKTVRIARQKIINKKNDAQTLGERTNRMAEEKNYSNSNRLNLAARDCSTYIPIGQWPPEFQSGLR